MPSVKPRQGEVKCIRDVDHERIEVALGNMEDTLPLREHRSNRTGRHVGANPVDPKRKGIM
jgi:hypothetical protein